MLLARAGSLFFCISRRESKDRTKGRVQLIDRGLHRVPAQLCAETLLFPMGEVQETNWVALTAHKEHLGASARVSLVRGSPGCCTHAGIGAQLIALDIKSCSSSFSMGLGRVMDGKSQFTEREKKRREKNQWAGLR